MPADVNEKRFSKCLSLSIKLAPTPDIVPDADVSRRAWPAPTAGMADGGAVGYAGDIVAGGIGLVRRGIDWLLDENHVGRDRRHVAAGPQDRPPEAMEPGPLAGPDAEPEYAHRVNGAAAAAAAAADATAQAAERARMATRSRYAFVVFMSLSFLAGFGVGLCWCTATARLVSSGDSGYVLFFPLESWVRSFFLLAYRERIFFGTKRFRHLGQITI